MKVNKVEKNDRSNLSAEENIFNILKHWRLEKRSVVFVNHVSENPKSIFYHQSHLSKNMDEIAPKSNEPIFEKGKSSIFSANGLEDYLKGNNITKLLLVGFTANDCIDSSARDASGKEFTTCVVGDGTASFELKGIKGEMIEASRVHELTLANLEAFYAKVVMTKEVLGQS